MAIRYLKKHAALEGVVSVEDAEALLQWLRARPEPAVHLGKCEHVHGATLQVLLAVKPKLVALPKDPWLASVLAEASHAAAADQPSAALEGN